MNPHSTQILGFLIIVAAAILSANGIRQRLLTLLTILAFIAGGLGVAFAIGAWEGNAPIRGNMAISWMLLLGAVGALRCLISNRRSRTRRRLRPVA